MRRWTIGLAALACIAVSDLPTAQAFNRRSTAPPRYTRGSYAETLVRKTDGVVTTRQVYSGYSNRFPPPAFLYYGYPHSGDGTGIGPLDRK